MSLSLFSTKPSESGFRLHSYEVWNWGTFDNKIWSIHPHGETSLLTGANASGKTTLIDGLLTLLVPEKRMRYYNQTAGSKGERTEESYVLGEYGESEDLITNLKEIKRLRGEKSKVQSVILAVFKNETLFITLAQARWFAGSELKRTFILSYNALSIENDFSPFDSDGDWKKRLKQKYAKLGTKEIVHLMESPGEYGRLMQKVFGLRSEKAHTLFSQTIGLKILGNLDEFVRIQMLEERDFEAEFQKIKSHFKTLNDAHKTIEKSYRQIELLTPIREMWFVLTKLKTEVLEQELFREVAPLWFSSKQKALSEDFIGDQSKKLAILSDTISENEGEIERLNNEERDLELQIKADDIGSQISNLKNRNVQILKSKEEKIKELNDYNKLADVLDFASNPQSQELFEEQKAQCLLKRNKLVEQRIKNEEEQFKAKTLNNNLKDKFDTISDQLTVLRAQNNNITGAPARIRKEILENVGATEEEICFVGELIKVNQSESEWEPAIEKLLHNFALRLIIPEKYYAQANRFINDNDLKGRIVYHRFDKKKVQPRIFINTEVKELINKLMFKNSVYKEWLESEIALNYNYICSDDLEEFRLSNKALTRSGLIKNGNRHEKDDRNEIRTRNQYILGWDNKEKIASLKESARLINDKIHIVKSNLTYYTNQLSRIENEYESLIRFSDFKNYSRINWWVIVDEIKSNEQKIEELSSKNNRMSALNAQRNSILKDLQEKKKLVESLKDQSRDIKTTVSKQEQNLREAEEVLQNHEGIELNEKLKRFEDIFLESDFPDINTIEKVSRKITKEISDKLEGLRNDSRRVSANVEGLMRKFIQPNKEITDQFQDWNADTHRLRENAEFIEDYILLLERIEKQELAKHKLKFKKYLNEEMITKMSDFQTWLESQEDDIEASIETLNESLKKIDFKKNPKTFIQLRSEKDYAPKIKEFKIRINDWKPNLGEFERTRDESILEASFIKIKTLLDDLTHDDNTRKLLLDVRNWLKFKAVEHYREDISKIFRTYTGTAKLSGGEGAQLTYTILSSAIAYQFGIHGEGLNTNSFRFICVDEAFSKQDDEKAKFLMELCKQLHLQVMVVSPAKPEEVAIVEPYIARVHFVQRKDNRHSVVYDMPIKQLQEHRSEYLNVPQ